MTRSYGETIYAQQANKEYAGVSDKDSPAQVAFRSAYTTMKSSGLESAKPAFLAIVNDHLHEDVAAKSLYTIGVGYEDMKRFDSAVVYYRRVVKDYPYSQYAEYLKPKMQYALQEKKVTPPTPPPVEVPKQVIANPVQNPLQDSVKKNMPNVPKPLPPNPKDQKPPQQTPVKKK
ncbi:MAG: tol-pal system YbgF family protein [Candidatus Kapaibacterium sp.]